MSKEERYHQLCHAMQSGVAAEMGFRLETVEPKHLRVGVNTAKCEVAGLARLLMEKGLITEDEYWDAIIQVMEEEVARYEAALSLLMGTRVTLG